MLVVVLFRARQRLSRSVFGSRLAGDGLLVRLRSTSIGILGLVTAVGLGLVAFVAQLGWPGAFDAPIPGPPTGTVHRAIALSPPAQGAASAGIGEGRGVPRLFPRHAGTGRGSGGPGVGSGVGGSHLLEAGKGAAPPATPEVPAAPAPASAPAAQSPPSSAPIAQPAETPATTESAGTTAGSPPSKEESKPGSGTGSKGHTAGKPGAHSHGDHPAKAIAGGEKAKTKTSSGSAVHAKPSKPAGGSPGKSSGGAPPAKPPAPPAVAPPPAEKSDPGGGKDEGGSGKSDWHHH